MKRKYLILIVIAVMISTCKSNEDNIIGVWIYQGQNTSSVFIKDSIKFDYQEPQIFDFQNNNEFSFKFFGKYNNSKNLKWFKISDSILKIDSLIYDIIYLDPENLVLREKTGYSSELLGFKKAKKVDIDLTREEIQEKLKNYVWSHENSKREFWWNHFQFFQNNTLIGRYKLYPKDTLDNLQLENWNIYKHRDYYLFYNYMDVPFGKGNFESISQLVDINDDFFKLLGIYEPNIQTFYSEQKKYEKPKLLGVWVSKNSRKMSYGNYLPENQIKNGITVLYDKTLTYDIQENKLEIILEDEKPQTFNWGLSKDGRILMLELDYDDGTQKGTFVKFADIIEASENNFKLRIFEKNFYTDKAKPRRYILNEIQEFQRQ